MRYFVRFAYRGTDFHGSQTQPNGITVQETMEKALSMVLRIPVSLTFAGRTDAGVHAREMWAHIDLPDEGGYTPAYFSEKSEKQRESKVLHRLNSILPDSIAIYNIVPVRTDAHARFDATQRTYEYHITTGKDIFGVGLRAQVAPGLDFEAMNEAAKVLLGRHDFASFCRVHTDVKTTFCTITHAEWITTGNTDEGESAYFVIAADRFLRNMVRAVVGTLFMVGRHQITKEQFCDIIEQRNRCAAGQSAPAEGLYLVQVAYPQEIFV